MPDQEKFALGNEKITSEVESVEHYEFEPIKGYPMLNWKGKRPFRSTQFYPAQLKEQFGKPVKGWLNEIYWGDNLQVMGHLLKKYRGQIKLVYIDPPFDSKADYKLKIQIKENNVSNNYGSFEEKQYSDIWTNDEYLQFMYERLILIRELLSDEGSIYLHCDERKAHYLRCLLDEIFGKENFVNEIIWKRRAGVLAQSRKFGSCVDTIFLYSKSDNYQFLPQFTKENTEDYINKRFIYTDSKGRKYRLSPIVSPSYSPSLIYEYKGYKPPNNGWACSLETMKKWDEEGKLDFPEDKSQRIQRKQYLDEWPGRPIQALWDDIPPINPQAMERLDYPTQKPEKLLERVITTSSLPGDIVFDCFMGSGTAQIASMKLGRRFIGADINLGAIQITTKRLVQVAQELKDETYYTGFAVYNVNHYDIFRNPVQAKELLIEALEIQPLPANSIYDGEKEGRMVKIMPINRIATRADLNELIAGFDYRTFEKRKAENPNKPVERLLLVCMGHEPDLKGHLIQEMKKYHYEIDVEVADIMRDKANLEFKRDSEAKVVVKNGNLVIEQFYPMNLLQKLSLLKENVEKWEELVESVMIDWNYDGAVLEPDVVDIPDENEFVKGFYPVPENTGTIRVKITDLLSESLEVEIAHG